MNPFGVFAFSQPNSLKSTKHAHILQKHTHVKRSLFDYENYEKKVTREPKPHTFEF